MSLNFAASTVTEKVYAHIFDRARQLEYREVDAFEARMGFTLKRERLEDAARVLSCPFKEAAPHWQHGRVIYAATRAYITSTAASAYRALDIGTAKGFSALCLLWAFQDAGAVAKVTSVDVLSPAVRVRRNTVAEVDGLKTLGEILAPWPEALGIGFLQMTGVEVLKADTSRIHVAFVDGKHTADVVRQEGKLLARRQEAGDLAIFDDCQMPPVSQAVASLDQWYRIEYLRAEPREYGIARRR